MATSLRDNLTSSYFNAAHKLYSKKARRRIIAYVEAMMMLLSGAHYSKSLKMTNIISGDASFRHLPWQREEMVLMNTLNTKELGRSLIACVDSDYDFLLQGATNTSRKINRNKYIFQTYTYAIENYHCFAESLHEVCAGYVERPFYTGFQRLSETVFRNRIPAFSLWNIWFYRQRDTYTFPMYDFHTYTALREISLKHPEHSLEALQHRVNQKLSELKKNVFPYCQSGEQLT